MFCKHDYEKISEVLMPSAWEQMKMELVNEVRVRSWMYNKKLIIVLKCKKCPKIKKIVEELMY